MTGEDAAPAEPPSSRKRAPRPRPRRSSGSRSTRTPSCAALEEHEELPPYEPARAPDGDPLMDHEPFAEDPEAAPPPHPADFAPAPEPEQRAPTRRIRLRRRRREALAS